MADNSTGLPVKSLATETVRARLVDSAGTNEVAISAAGRISVDGSGVTQPVSGTVAIGTSVVPGTAATNLGKAEDAAHTTGDTGVFVLAVRNDAGTALAGTDLDYIPFTTDATGALRVTGGSSGTQYTEDAPSAGGESLTLAGAVRQDAIVASTSLDGDYANLKVNNVGRLYTSATVDAALPAGTNNIGDVDVLTVPAPLSTSGNGTAASALRVTLASDGTGVVTLTGSLPAGTNNIGDVDVLTVPAPLSTTGNGTAATALRVTLASDSTGTTAVTQATAANLNAQVVGTAAADAPASGNPVYVGGRASAAAPTDVTADGDVVPEWRLRNGAAATVLTAAGALIGGDATNGLDVDVTRVSGTVASNITQVGGVAVGATSFLPTRLTDGTAYYANTGQTAGTAHFARITDATNTAAVIATINSLKTDLSSVAGAVPSATNAVPVRLTDGAAFYSSASGAPATPTVSTVTSAALGAGASVDLNHTLIANGTTGHLMGVDVASTVPLKIEIKTVDGSDVATTRVVLFATTYSGVQWRSPYKTFITRAGAAANTRFRVTVTNKDNNTAADVYSTAYFDIV